MQGAELSKDILKAQNHVNPGHLSKKATNINGLLEQFIIGAQNAQKEIDRLIEVVQAHAGTLQGELRDIRSFEQSLAGELKELSQAGGILATATKEPAITALPRDKLEQIRDEIRRVYELFQSQQNQIKDLREKHQKLTGTTGQIDREMINFNNNLKKIREQKLNIRQQISRFNIDIKNLKGIKM